MMENNTIITTDVIMVNQKRFFLSVIHPPIDSITVFLVRHMGETKQNQLIVAQSACFLILRVGEIKQDQAIVLADVLEFNAYMEA